MTLRNYLLALLAVACIPYILFLDWLSKNPARAMEGHEWAKLDSPAPDPRRVLATKAGW